MARRSRIIGYGGSLLLVVLGTLLAALVSDTLGLASAVALVSIGLVAATSLVFYEVGLSEDRQRAREATARRLTESPVEPVGDEPARRLVRPGRIRGSR